MVLAQRLYTFGFISLHPTLDRAWAAVEHACNFGAGISGTNQQHRMQTLNITRDIAPGQFQAQGFASRRCSGGGWDSLHRPPFGRLALIAPIKIGAMDASTCTSRHQRRTAVPSLRFNAQATGVTKLTIGHQLATNVKSEIDGIKWWSPILCRPCRAPFFGQMAWHGQSPSGQDSAEPRLKIWLSGFLLIASDELLRLTPKAVIRPAAAATPAGRNTAH